MVDTKQETIDGYDGIASEYGISHFDHFWIDEFDCYRSAICGNRVVDLGCGAGRDAAIFTANGFDYTGIDASGGMLKVAGERVPNAKFRKRDFSKTCFRDGEFDGFWAAASFLHVPKIEIAEVLQEARRITKSDGIGFISVKERDGIESGVISANRYGGVRRYFSFYTGDEFERLLTQNGLPVEKVSIHTENDDRQTRWLCFFVKVQK